MRSHRGSLAGAFVAVALGVAVVALSTLLYASGQPRVPDRFAGVPVVVQSAPVQTPAEPFPETLPWSKSAGAALADRLATVEGVAAAVPDRVFYAQPVIGGEPVADAVRGHGWSSARLAGGRGMGRLVAGAPPSAERDVVLDAGYGARPGDSVTILLATGPIAYTVTGLVDGPGLYLSDPAAEALSPGVRAIGLVLRDGADVERVAGEARRLLPRDGSRVLSGDERAELEPRADARTRWIGMQVLTGMAALAGFVSVFVVASTFAFHVALRRRQLALLRTIGATPRQVRRMVYGEAVSTGTVAALAGVLVGVAAAPAVGGVLVDVGFEPPGYSVRLVAWPLLVSFAVGPVVALLGAWTAARRASRVRPLEALRDASVESTPMGRLRWVVGVLVTAGGLALALGAATADDATDGGSYAMYSAMALVSGATLLAPAFVPAVAWFVGGVVLRGRGAVGMLVREGALAAPRRTAATAAPVLLTVAFAVLIGGLVSTSTGAWAAGREARVNAGWVLLPDGTPGLSDAAASSVPGAAILSTTVYVGPDTEPAEALGIDTASFVAVNRRLTVLSGSLDDLDDDSVVLTSRVAAANDTGTATFDAVFADGERVALRIAAVVSDSSAPAGVLLTRATVRRHDASALTSWVFVAGHPGEPTSVGTRVVTVAQFAAEEDSREDQLVWTATLLLILVSAGYGALAVANTLLTATAHRARDLLVLRRCGATAGQVRWTVIAESVLVVLVGSVLGGAVALVALLSIRAGLSEQIGAPVELVVPWTLTGGVVGLCLLLAVAASVISSWLSPGVSTVART